MSHISTKWSFSEKHSKPYFNKYEKVKNKTDRFFNNNIFRGLHTICVSLTKDDNYVFLVFKKQIKDSSKLKLSVYITDRSEYYLKEFPEDYMRSRYFLTGDTYDSKRLIYTYNKNSPLRMIINKIDDILSICDIEKVSNRYMSDVFIKDNDLNNLLSTTELYKEIMKVLDIPFSKYKDWFKQPNRPKP